MEERITEIWRKLNNEGTLIKWRLEPFEDQIAVNWVIEINGKKLRGCMIPTLKLFQDDHHLCTYLMHSAADEIKRQILRPKWEHGQAAEA